MKQQILFESERRGPAGTAGCLGRRAVGIPGPAGERAGSLAVKPYDWPFLEHPRQDPVPLLQSSRIRGSRQSTLGALGDPYGSEAAAGRTRQVLEDWQREWGRSIWVITRSDRVERDLHLLRSLSVRHRLLVSVMVCTLDPELARRLEPASPSPQARLQALGRLSRAGVATGGMLLPILPGVNDSFAVLEGLMAALVEAGIGQLNVAGMRLNRPQQREACLKFLEGLAAAAGNVARRWFSAGAEWSPDYARVLATRIRVLRQKFGLAAEGLPEGREQLWLPGGGASFAA